MTNKTFSKILAFGMGILVVTTLVTVVIFHSYYEEQAQINLSNTASVVAGELNTNENYSFINNSISDTRLTLISADGTVLADSEEKAENMENHANRPEVREALETGKGSTIRKSATLDENTYYSAVKLDNGNVLRVSVTSKSVYIVFYNSLIILAVIMLVIMMTALGISFAITKSIVNPITEMGKRLDDIENVETYSELQPFVDAISQQRKKQKMLDNQKKQFTANVSHELKTPLTSIAGYAELIENGMAKEENIRPFAHTIRTQALRLVNLTEDIIQLSQLDEVENDITFEELNLSELAEKCAESLEMNAQTKNVSLEVSGENCFIMGNKALIEELIYNLIDNAIRYNKEEGSVTISTEYLSDGTLLTVSDTGIGIAKKYQDRIFERFFRVDKSRSKQTGGTGLGLAIVKHIAQVHGAHITLESTEDVGTTIEVEFNNS